MFNQEVAKQLVSNTEVWEEISDTQGEAIRGGAPSATDIAAKFEQIVAVTSGTPNYDEEKTNAIIANIAEKNGAIRKFF
jgi:hypothetical protein